MGLEKILERIKKYDKIAIYGHIRPDGDCIGSQIGLKDIIKTSFPEKEVYVVGEVSEYVSFIGVPDTVSDEFTKEALSIVVDTSNEERVSDERFKNGLEIIKIDHHIPNTNYGNLIWVNTKFPACAEMISYFYYRFRDELKMSPIGANALYTGIVTDTGRFKYGVRPLTYQLAALLIKLGADTNFIDFNLGKRSLNEVQLEGEVLSNFVKTPGGFVYFLMTRDIINKYQVSDEDAAAKVSSLAGIENCPVWALIIEYPDSIRIRLRSNGPNIDGIANQFGGGGHAKAAGGKLDSWEDVDKLVTAVEEVIKEYNQK